MKAVSLRTISNSLSSLLTLKSDILTFWNVIVQHTFSTILAALMGSSLLPWEESSLVASKSSDLSLWIATSSTSLTLFFKCLFFLLSGLGIIKFMCVRYSGTLVPSLPLAHVLTPSQLNIFWFPILYVIESNRVDLLQHHYVGQLGVAVAGNYSAGAVLQPGTLSRLFWSSHPPCQTFSRRWGTSTVRQTPTSPITKPSSRLSWP